MVRLLGKMEAAREIVESLTLPLDVQRGFRQDASARMTHYSTKVEGNQLTLKQTKELLAGQDVIAREIDKREVINYYDCLDQIHRLSRTNPRVTEPMIKGLHATIQRGIVKGKLRGEYRETQNAIFDSVTREPVYFPPETKDIPNLMKAYVAWLNRDRDIHPILKAGIAHYQFVTIHPFMDGNGRTARAVATLVLYQNGFDLKRFYSLEDYYAEDLKGYYNALHRCQGMYYYDQPDPDITSWLEYFLQGVVIAFEQVKDNALAAARKNGPDESHLPADVLQKIGPREHILLSHFEKNLQIRSKDICRLFDINERTARDLLGKWIEEGILQKQGSGNRNAYYVLTPPYQQLFDWSYDKPSAHLDAKLKECLRVYRADKSVQRRPYHA
jgi:Fic family protein